MALETDHPDQKRQRPKEPQPKDTLPPFEEHDTTSGGFYGTTEGVKESETQFEQVEVPKRVASNVAEPKEHDRVEDESREDPAKRAKREKEQAKAVKRGMKPAKGKALPKVSSKDTAKAAGKKSVRRR